jgi:hypothetical protein
VSAWNILTSDLALECAESLSCAGDGHKQTGTAYQKRFVWPVNRDGEDVSGYNNRYKAYLVTAVNADFIYPETVDDGVVLESKKGSIHRETEPFKTVAMP